MTQTAHLTGREVGVVGAGVAGLTLALCVAARGGRVRVYERADALREVGAGLQLSANALRVFSALGLAPEATLPAMRPATVTLRTLAGGHRLMQTRQNGPGRAPYLQVHRADLIDWLAAAARDAGVDVLTGREVAVDGASIDGRRFDHVAIAAGVRGADRPGPAPRFTGQVAWRALVPADAAPGVAAGGTQVFLAPGRHLVLYPLRDGRQINLVAVEDGQDWRGEGWDHPGDVADLRTRFAPACAPAAAVLAAVETARRWALCTHPSVQMLSVDQIPLVGDAAQTMLPFMAQGAGMAIEDAWVLADCWDRNAPLADYAATRAPRRAAVAARAEANGRIFHEDRRWLLPAHRLGMWGLGRVAPGLLDRRTGWIYDHDVTRGR